MTIQDLLTEKGKLAAQAAEILDSAAKDNRLDLRTDEQAKFDAIHVDIEKISKHIEARRKQDEVSQSLETGQGRRSDAPDPEPRHEGRMAARMPQRVESIEAMRGWLLPGHMRTDAMRTAAARLGVSLDTKEFKFHLPAKPLMGTTDAQIERWRRDNDEYRAAFGVGSGAIGGYTVPDAMMQALEAAQLTYSNIRTVARVVRTDTGASLPFPTVNDTSNKGALLAENAQVSETEPSFTQLTLDAYKFSSKSILVSVEFLQDTSINATEEIGRLLGQRIGRITNDYFTTGTGSSQPKGVVTGATDSTVTAASQTLFTHDELVDVIHSVDPAYRPGSRWMFADATLKNLKKIKVLQYSGDTVGMPLWQPGLTLGAPDTILGYPYVINQSMASPAASAKTILFGDFSHFLIRDVREVVLVRLDERYADYHQVGFLAFSRSDSDLLDAGTHPIVWADQAA
jgi:HK97 family phage major capsid protein